MLRLLLGNVIPAFTLTLTHLVVAALGQAAPPPVIEVTMEDNGFGYFSGLADVGVLDIGQNNLVRLQLANEGTEPILLGEVSASCGCVKVEKTADVIQAGGQCIVNLQLQPDRNYAATDWTQSISFNPPPGQPEASRHVVSVRVRARPGRLHHIRYFWRFVWLLVGLIRLRK